MAFIKGQSGNKPGRKPGVPDKRVSLVKEIVTKALGMEPVEYLIELIKEMPTRAERAEHIQKLLPYIHPKLSNIEHSGGIDTGGDSDTVEKLATILKELKNG